MAFNKNSNFNKHQDNLFCVWCNKKCKNLNSLKQHECRCKNNPNKKISFGLIKYNKEGKNWARGKTKETNESIAKHAEKVKLHYKTNPGTFKGKHHTKEAIEKIRQSALSRELGGWNKKNQINYKNVKLGSSYEVEVAKELDKNNVKWVRPSYLLYTDLNGKEHRYYPDFYLPEYNVYLDPKNDFLINSINKNFGYSDLDKIKWVIEQNKVKVIILNKNELNWETIKILIV